MPNVIEQRQNILFLLGGLIFLLLVYIVAPPTYFPSGSIVTINEGSGLTSVASSLESAGVIRSRIGFRIITFLLSGENKLKAGQYYFGERVGSVSVAWRIIHGDYRIETVKLTIPEGFTVEKISALFDSRFPFFDNPLFERGAPEGYLFPDTYFVPVTATASSAIKIMRDNFDNKIHDVLPEIEKSGKGLGQIITMASLIEAETNNQADREIVSGILWKRLKMGMALQVDADKKTYEFQGLPSAPINNPGILSIRAAVSSTSTPYLYYLTGDDGKMHYAKTFDEHQVNIQKYFK